MIYKAITLISDSGQGTSAAVEMRSMGEGMVVNVTLLDWCLAHVTCDVSTTYSLSPLQGNKAYTNVHC